MDVDSLAAALAAARVCDDAAGVLALFAVDPASALGTAPAPGADLILRDLAPSALQADRRASDAPPA